MDNKENLKNMIDAIIDDNSEKAEVDFHTFCTNKTKDVIGVTSDDDEGVDDEGVEIEVETDED